MYKNRVKTSSILENQLPSFVKEEYPLFVEFFKKYYGSLDTKGSPKDILENIDQYVKLDLASNIIEETVLTSDIESFDTEITVQSVKGFPDNSGLIQIGTEIIFYGSKNTATNTFENCIRGFSGRVEKTGGKDNEIVFESTFSDGHTSGSVVKNLSSIFLKIFLSKLKKQYIPGFESRTFNENLNQATFIKHARDFYSAKGTEESFRILFKALYGVEADIVRPSDYIFQASDAQFKIDSVISVEVLNGDIYKLLNKTIYQDQYGSINRAYGTINNIVKIYEDNREYYTLSLDSDVERDISLGRGTTLGNFSVHPTTHLITQSATDADTLDVDSTIGFPSSGIAYIKFDDGVDVTFNYESKSTNQFYGCSGITRVIPAGSMIRLDTFAYGYGNSEEDIIKLRVTGLLSEFKYPDVSLMYKDDTVEISNLGYSEESDFRTNNWIFNTSIKCKVKELRNIFNFSYEITTFDDINILDGDSVTINAIIRTRDGRLENVTREFEASTGSNPKNTLKVTNDTEIVYIYYVQRNLRKVAPSFKNTADVTNTYVDSDRNTYVISPSLPHYANENFGLKTRIVFFDANISSANVIAASNHGFLSGDAVVYHPGDGDNALDIPKGIYFVRRIDNNRLSLSKSRSDVFQDITIPLSGNVTNNILAPLEFHDEFLNIRELQSQKLVRKLTNPELTESTYETLSGPVGIFANGVEILNYKSPDVIKYGSIEDVIVSAPGSGYDLINPPIINVEDFDDSPGIGASCYSRVTGSLERIDIVDPGVDYINEPFIKVTGGNGVGALAKASMLTYTHSVSLNPTAEGRKTDINTNTISFRFNHQFKTGERVIYKIESGSPIGGLVNNSSYYVSVVGSKKIKLHDSYEKALRGSPSYDPETGLDPGESTEINLTSYGSGVHLLESYNKRKKIGSIRILNSGNNYSNKKTTFNEDDIDLYDNKFNIKKHGYKTGEIVVFTQEQEVGGLVNNKSYYVLKINENSFRLAEIGSPDIGEKFYLENNFTVDIATEGSGSFNYPPIEVTLSGTVGVSSYYFTGVTTTTTFNSNTPYYVGIDTTNIQVGQIINEFSGFISSDTRVTSIGIGSIGISTSHLISSGIATTSITLSEYIDFNAKIIPVFRGEIDSIIVTSKGSNYGSNCLNHDRQPLISFQEGKDARAIPVVSDGRIKEVLVQNRGGGYTSQPNIEVFGDGVGARLTPVIGSDGRLESIKVITEGNGYNPNNTRILITNSGVGFNADVVLTRWTVNLFSRYLTSGQISEEGGVLTRGRRGLQYCHFYAPTQLRTNLYSEIDNGIAIRYQSDIINDTSRVKYHSPIIGWAYDGNPIYGPYGFKSPDSGGSISQMRSGYVLERKENRPPDYPLGFFVEDYEFRDGGTLDKHNGRFCKTPEYPNGTYAYFCTFTEDIIDNGTFSGQKLPEFPYVIGESYRSLPIEFNYQSTSNEDRFDFRSNALLRNTKHYNLNSNDSEYPFVINSSKIRRQTTDVKASSSGSVDSIEIISGGENYKVNDVVVFNNSKTDGGFGAYAYVSEIVGKDIDTISTKKTNIENIELVPSGVSPNDYMLFCENPHGFSDFEDITIIGINTDAIKLNPSYEIRVPYHQLQLRTGIGTIASTGISTYIEVYGKLSNPEIYINDHYQINNEVVKILDLDPINSKARIYRGINGADGEHEAGQFLIEKPRRFRIYDEVKKYNYDRVKEKYFVPEKSVGFGTVGIGTVIFIDLLETQSSASVGVGTQTILYFNNPNDIFNFNSGGYVNISNSSDPQFNISKRKIVSVAISEITVDFDTSTLSGVGVTVYVDKWNSIQTNLRSIYIPNHGFRTGQPLKYNSYIGTGLTVSTNTLDEFILQNNQDVYAAKISEDFIGITTTPVGIGTDGGFVGLGSTASNLLYFVGIGTGNIHSFKTNNERQIVKLDVEQKLVTVTTNDNPRLRVGESIALKSTPSIKNNVKLIYDDISRRLISSPRRYVPSSLDLQNNIIRIDDHSFVDGEKVLLKTASSGTGLENNNYYYVLPIDNNRFKLSKFYKNREENILDISGESTGTFYSINPQYSITRGQSLVFDLSDESLSYETGITRSPAFKLEIFSDRTLKTLFNSSRNYDTFEVKSYGTVGITTDARVEILATDLLPNLLYYKLTPVLDKELPIEKANIVIDTINNPLNSTIKKEESIYSGRQTIVGISTTSFSYTIKKNPESIQYSNNSDGNFEYYTRSTLSSGSIKSINLLNGGKNYKKLPYVERIETESGKDALIFPKSESIGKILTTRLNDPGYDYPSDPTLRPEAKLPQIIKLDPLASFESIQIISEGVNYSIPPEIIVKDGYTRKIISDVVLKYERGDNFVNIEKNTTGIYDVSPIFIPKNNSNGINISNISYDFDTKIVTINLAKSYSSLLDFPFRVGDKFILENISTTVNIGFSNRGYNSENYNYEYFEVLSIDPNIGGFNPSLTFSMSEFLRDGQSPGSFNRSNSLGRIIPVKHFPVLNATLRKNNFFIGETINGVSRLIDGVIEDWDLENQYMKISSRFRFSYGDIIKGVSSGSQAVIQSAEQINGFYNINSSSTFERGWEKSTGFLNNSLQRLHDNDYYQYLSYAVKSPISMDVWDDAVATLNHPSGFKKFSDLSILSSTRTVGLSTEQNFGDFTSKVDIDSVISINSTFDFDLVTENSINIAGRNVSEQIEFNSAVIQDYAKSIGNKVLLIDDISPEFNSDPRIDRFSIVNTFRLNEFRSRKYVITIKDRRFTGEKEVLLVSLLHNDREAYFNQYASSNTVYDMGYFDTQVFGEQGRLLFYPKKFEFNDYDTSFISFDITDVDDIGSFNLGNSVHIRNDSKEINVGVAQTTIFEVPDTYNASKILMTYKKSDGTYEFDEISLIHNGTEVELLEYGQLTDIPQLTTYGSPGFGTYLPYIENGVVKIDFIPYDTTQSITANSFIIDLNSNASGVGSTEINTGILRSFHTNIPSSPSPSETIVAEYSNIDNNGCYIFALVNDITNSNTQVSEIIVTSESLESNIVEFGTLSTLDDLGTFTCDSDGSNTSIKFTPLSDIEVNVVVFQTSVRIPTTFYGITNIDI